MSLLRQNGSFVSTGDGPLILPACISRGKNENARRARSNFVFYHKLDTYIKAFPMGDSDSKDERAVRLRHAPVPSDAIRGAAWHDDDGSKWAQLSSWGESGSSV